MFEGRKVFWENELIVKVVRFGGRKLEKLEGEEVCWGVLMELEE